ncbi:MAG: hypothetical protein Sapg2KO_11010 [Saprospiraceae bacterium]
MIFFIKKPIILLLLLIHLVGIQKLVAQTLREQIQEADSLSRFSHTHLADSIYEDILANAKKEGDAQLQFELLIKKGENRKLYYQFDSIRFYINQAEEIFKSGVSIEPRLLGQYYFLKGHFLHNRGQYDISNDLLEESVSQLQKDSTAWKMLCQVYLFHAQTQVRRNEPERQKFLIDQAYKIMLAKEPDAELKGDASNQLARYYRLIGDMAAFFKYAQLTEKYYVEAFGPIHPKVAYACQYLSHYYEQRGDLNVMLAYLEKTQTIFDQLYPEHYGRMGQNAGLISNCYRRMRRYEEAHQYIDLSIEMLTNHLGTDKVGIMADMYRRKAQIYEAQDSLKNAVFYYEKSTRILDLFNRNSRDKSRNMQGLARSSFGQGQFEQATYWNKKDFENLIPNYGPDYIMLSESYWMAGALDIRNGKIMEGIAKLQLAIEKAAPSFKALSWEDLPASNQFSYIPTVLKIIKTRAEALVKLAQQSNQSERYLENALRTYLLGVDVMNLLRASYQEEDAKQIIQENGASIYKGAISTLIDLDALNPKESLQDSLFNMINRSKSLLLREAILDRQARDFAGIPDSLLEAERALKAAISSLRFSNSTNKDAYTNQKQQKELTALQSQFSDLRAAIAQDFPKYFALKYEENQIQIADLQAELEPEQSLIQYHLSHRYMSILHIQKDSYTLKNYPLPTELSEKVIRFRSALTDIKALKKDKASADGQLAALGHELFQILLEKPLKEQSNAVQNITIIPDGVLAYLPFEQLLTKSIEREIPYGKWPYLIKDYSISYAYSNILWHQQQLNKRPNKAVKLAAFAPSYGQAAMDSEDVLSMLRADEMVDLPGALKESQTIAKLMNGAVWSGIEATEAQFKAIAQDYSVFHFSMHGIINDQDPMRSHLLFQQTDPTLVDAYNDNILHMAELYGMELDAQMVVLSACNSGIGRLNRAEGLMSLSRAFSYSGVESIIMSMWSVPDQSTAELMIDFYKQLKKGLPKDEALRAAKLSYLENNDDPLFAHPYFWSGFLSIGQQQALYKKSNNGFLFGGLTLICFVIGGFYLSRKKLISK